jgi:GTP-binding protein YchF
MALRVGIVGLPNVGKSTLFNALTAAGAEAVNYPFSTIEPNVGVVPVPDDRLDRLARMVTTERIVPATLEVVDIAGLVEGASRGEGLGNQFLHHIRNVDAVIHVVRCFDDPGVTHVAGRVDPVGDIETVETELGLADLATLEKRMARAERAIKTGDRAASRELELVARIASVVGQGLPARDAGLDDSEWSELGDLQLLTAKPVLYVCNVGEGGDASGVAAVRRLASDRGAPVVEISARIEAELLQLDPEERRAFLAELGVARPALELVIEEAYRLLDLVTFFTLSPKEIRAWTVTRGTKAPTAAGKIHTDFERGFVRAEVFRVEDLEEAGSEAELRARGRIRSEGRDYEIRDGDVIRFRFNV